MKVAVHYSTATADLYNEGLLQIDCFKCPAWPTLVPTAQHILPIYIHFPLKAGLGTGIVIDTETKLPVKWEKIERFLAQTSTPFINIHLSPTINDHPHIPADTTLPEHVERVTEFLIKDVQVVVKRFGASQVIVENDHIGDGTHLCPAFLPQVINAVVEETGCGFLLDLAHARLAADYLGINVYDYIRSLPVSKLREVHVSGVQMVEGRWLELFRDFDNRLVERFGHKLLDHLPMTATDWQLVDWSLKNIRDGQWSKPWVVAMECGGVSPLWELVTFKDVLEQQVPLLYDAVKKHTLTAQWKKSSVNKKNAANMH